MTLLGLQEEVPWVVRFEEYLFIAEQKWIFNVQGICQLLNSIKSYQKICRKKIQHWFLRQVFTKLSSIQFTFFINNLKNEITVQSMDNNLKSKFNLRGNMEMVWACKKIYGL